MAKEGKKTFDAHDYMSECTVEILLGKYNFIWKPLKLYIFPYIGFSDWLQSIQFIWLKILNNALIQLHELD